MSSLQMDGGGTVREERDMNDATHSDARGFSLVELTVALVVTLIVTGAIYGLLAGGQSAFRREPELSDRQQNIRVAMDLIMRDVANAGSSLPPFVQAFTQGLDACAGCPAGGSPMGLAGQRTDELEMLTNDGSLDNEPVCANRATGAASANVRLVRNVIPTPAPPAPPSGAVAILFGDGTWTMRYVTSAVASGPAGDTNCTAGTPTLLNFANGATDLTGGLNPAAAGNVCTANNGGIPLTGTPRFGNNNSGATGCPGTANVAGPCCMVAEVSYAQVVRYRIRNNGTVPELQRYDSANAGAGFQAVARGIEDLQVQYSQADGTVTPTGLIPGAPVVTRGAYNTIVTQVQVTLSSRSEARNIQGATTDAIGNYIRGSLTWVGSPRAALAGVTTQPPVVTSPSPSPTPWWK
jgi:prepilin-type N-terminal cleavage/methylation domain-containing protein